jgi:predicted ArsR family transcriptional regulator
MINLDGVRWGTAKEIAVQLGHGVTEAAVRSWAARDGLLAVRVRDGAGRPQVRYPLTEAARIDAAKRRGGRGRLRSAQRA